jgi:hypothetical protein
MPQCGNDAWPGGSMMMADCMPGGWSDMPDEPSLLPERPGRCLSVSRCHQSCDGWLATAVLAAMCSLLAWAAGRLMMNDEDAVPMGTHVRHSAHRTCSSSSLTACTASKSSRCATSSPVMVLLVTLVCVCSGGALFQFGRRGLPSG